MCVYEYGANCFVGASHTHTYTHTRNDLYFLFCSFAPLFIVIILPFFYFIIIRYYHLLLLIFVVDFVVVVVAPLRLAVPVLEMRFVVVFRFTSFLFYSIPFVDRTSSEMAEGGTRGQHFCGDDRSRRFVHFFGRWERKNRDHFKHADCWCTYFDTEKRSTNDGPLGWMEYNIDIYWHFGTFHSSGIKSLFSVYQILELLRFRRGVKWIAMRLAITTCELFHLHSRYRFYY